MDLVLELQKTNVGIQISILEIPCVPIFRKNEHFLLFRPKLAQILILGSEFGILNVRIWNQDLQDTMYANFQSKQTTLIFSA